jgi:hypothetical protein
METFWKPQKSENICVTNYGKMEMMNNRVF